MADSNNLFGSCACERNQYTILLPSSSTSLAHVFFDNSAANRKPFLQRHQISLNTDNYPGRSQATPVTAWLRVPLELFHSTTYAHFPDETHHSIRRTFNTPTANPELPATRRQFCGYCGTHLTAWHEGEGQSADYLDVTLGSLLGESVERLEALGIIPDTGDDEDGLVRGGDVQDEDHIPTSEESMRGVEGPGASSLTQRAGELASGRMRDRGIPYFEEMVENSRLGRIKRQKGGHTSRDGTTSVQWEVVEIGGDEPASRQAATEAEDEGGNSSKRQKTGA